MTFLAPYYDALVNAPTVGHIEQINAAFDLGGLPPSWHIGAGGATGAHAVLALLYSPSLLPYLLPSYDDQIKWQNILDTAGRNLNGLCVRGPKARLITDHIVGL